MADKIKGITVEIGANEKPLRQALTSLNKDIKATQGNLKEVEKLLKLDPNNTNLLREKQKLLADQIGKTTTKLEALKKAQEEAKKMLANGEIGTKEYENLENQISQCETELGKLQEKQAETERKMKPSAEKIGEAFKNVGDKVEEVGKKLAPLSGAAAAGLGIAVKTAKDWETAFTGVKKTVDGTEEDFARLGKGIQDMATRTASSAEEIAGVAEVAGQLGVSADDILEFTETMVQLGDTTNLSSSEAATALARFINVTGGSQKDVSKLGSAVVELGNNFATDEASIVNMSQRLASAGKIAGLSETDILALATAMSSVGIQAEAGGTAMTQSLDGIDKIVRGTAKDSGKKLQTLARISGMSADNFAKAWKSNPIEAIQAFTQGLGELDGEGESATEVLDELGMTGIRQGNMLKSLSLASGVLTKAVKTSSDAYRENTALTNEANKRYETFDARLSQTKESAKQVAVEFGEVMLPVLKDLLDDIKGIIQWIKGLDEETKKTIVTVTAVVAALSPLLIIGGKLISGLGSLIQMVPKITGFMSGIGGPISLAVAGIGAVVAITANYRKELEETEKEHATLSDSAQQLADKIDAEAQAWENVESARKNAYAEITQQADQEKLLWDQLTKVVDAQGKVIKGHEAEAAAIVNDLQSALGIEIELIDGQIKGYDVLKESIDEVIEKKKAEALLTADMENYTKALLKHDEAARDVADAEYQVYQQEQKVSEQQGKVDELQRKLNQARADGNDETGAMAATINDLTKQLEKEEFALRGDKTALDELKAKQDTARSTLDKYDATLANHDRLQKSIASGSTQEMQRAQRDLVNGLLTAEKSSKEALQRQTQGFLTEYQKQREIVQTTGSQEAKTASYNMHALVVDSINELKKLDPKLAAEMQKELNTINSQSQRWNLAGKKNADSLASGAKQGLQGVPGIIKEKLNLSGAAGVWGKDMMQAYASSIRKYSSLPSQAAGGVAKSINRVLGFSEPEEGPLSDFHTYGPDMMKLLATGITSSEYEVLNAVQGVAGSIRAALSGTTVTAQLDQKSIPLSPGVTLNIANFNNYSDSDIRELTNEIMETAASFAARKGAVFA